MVNELNQLWSSLMISELYNLITLQKLLAFYKDSGFPGVSVLKNLTANAGAVSLIPGSGRALGEGNGNPCQYACLGNPMDRGAWWATVQGFAKELDTTQELNNNYKGSTSTKTWALTRS